MSLSPPPLRTPLLLANGTLSPAWAQALDQLYTAAIAGEDAALMAAFGEAASAGGAGVGLAVHQHLQAALPSLAASDAGYLAWVTDYHHLLYWNGTAWQWGPGENGSGYIQFFAIAPGTGWALVNGAAITYLRADGTTASVTPGAMNDGRYVRGGAAFTGIANAAGQTGVPSATATAGTGTAVTLGSGTHTHLTGDPKNMDWLPYFRK